MMKNVSDVISSSASHVTNKRQRQNVRKWIRRGRREITEDKKERERDKEKREEWERNEGEGKMRR